jgi:hypothetical protein
MFFLLAEVFLGIRQPSTASLWLTASNRADAPTGIGVTGAAIVKYSTGNSQ